tara:strand:- start:5063 stop:5473 length:411 start_codon:yes stop_codon:yes gene_type:complete
MATVNVTLSLSSTDLFAKQTLSFTETDSLSPAGDQKVVGRIYTTGSGTKDNLMTKALDGTDDRAYVFLRNLSSTTGEYVKVSLCATHGTDSASGDWFAVLGPGEFMFMPTSTMQDLDVEAAAGNPVVEYIVAEKAA